MKKIILSVALSCAINAVTAQDLQKQVEYNRGSLYTIMISSDKLSGSENEDIVTKAFDRMPLPDKYNDHNLKNRHVDITKVEVTKEEIEGFSPKKNGVGGLIQKGRSFLKKNTSSTQVGVMSDEEKIARINRYFQENHIANQLVGKWFNKSPKMNEMNGKKSHFNSKLVEERAMYNASKEDIDNADISRNGIAKIKSNGTLDLLSHTFVLATVYRYLSYDELAATVQAGAEVTKQLGFTGVGELAHLGASVFGDFTDGYWITAESYLFQLEWNDDIQETFFDTYWDAADTKEFDTTPLFKLKFVAMTHSLARAGKVLAKDADAATKEKLDFAMARATGKSIAKLQKLHPDFNILAPLYVSLDGKHCYAYIGKKEDVKSEDKFEVVRPKTQKDGSVTLEDGVTITVAKGKVWDNRAGAGIADLEESKEDADIDKNAKYTTFEDKPKSEWALGGYYVRQIYRKDSRKKTK